jgi:hypothetical protein
VNIDDIVRAFGGQNNMAAALGLTHSHIGYWRRVGYVPLKKHDAVLAAAERFRVPLSGDVLSDQMQRACPRPLGAVPTARVKAGEALALAASGVKPKEIATRLSISYSSVCRILRGDPTKRKVRR